MPTENEELLTIIPGTTMLTYEQVGVISDFRKVWNELAYWMRDFTYSLVDNHENLYAVTNKMYREIPLDFYNSLVVFYGEEIAERFLNLISQQILLFWRLIDAVKNKNTAVVDTTTQELYANSTAMATFMAQINPYWDEELWKNLLDLYISMKIEQILAIVQKNWDREIQIFSRIESHARIMGSYMARGVIARGLVPGGQAGTQPGVQIQ